MKKLRIAVTGGSGYLGKQVVRYFLKIGHTVYNLDRVAPSDTSSSAVHCSVDLRDRAQLQPLFENVDAVCHLAEMPNILPRVAASELYLHNVTVGATVLLTAAELKVPRVIYTSSCQVYGGVAVPLHFLPIDETHPYQPTDVYACAKIANEQLAQTLARAHGLSVAIFRLPAIWEYSGTEGWGKWFDGLPEYADGCATYVGGDDVARAYALALEHPRPGCEAYHLAAADVASALPVSELIEKRYPGFPQLPANWPKSRSVVDCKKAKDHFGWNPEFSALQTFRQLYGRDPLPPSL